MNHLPFHTAHHWITRLAQLPGPIYINQIPALAKEFQWKPTQEVEEYLHHSTSHSVQIRTPFDKDDKRIYSISFPVSLNRTRSLEGGIHMADIYCNVLQECTEHWGTPNDLTTRATGAIWKFNQNAYLKATLWPSSVIFSFETMDPNALH